MIESFYSCTTDIEASNSLLWGKAKALYDSQQHLPYLSCDNRKCLWTLLEARRNIRLCFHNFIYLFPSLEYNYYSLEINVWIVSPCNSPQYFSTHERLHLDTFLLPKPWPPTPSYHCCFCLSVSLMLGTIGRTMCGLLQLAITVALWGSCHYTYFTDEETEVRKEI